MPLGPEVMLEVQLLMLASYNILSPANGSSTTVSSQDMVLGLYYIARGRKSTPEYPIKGEGLVFCSPEKVNIAHNERKLSLNAPIRVRVRDLDEEGSTYYHSVETTTGRVPFNELVSLGVGYVSEVPTKKSLRDIAG